MLPAEISLVAVSAATVVGFGRVFEDGSFALSLTLAVVGSHVVAALARHRGWGLLSSAAVSALSLLLAATWFFYVDTTAFGVPTPGTGEALVGDLEAAWRLFGEVVAPAPAETGFLTALAAALWVAAFLADWAAFRIWSPVEAIVPASALFAFGSLLGADENRIASAGIFSLAVGVFLLTHRVAEQTTTQSLGRCHRHPGEQVAPGRGSNPRSHLRRGGGARGTRAAGRRGSRRAGLARARQRARGPGHPEPDGLHPLPARRAGRRGGLHRRGRRALLLAVDVPGHLRRQDLEVERRLRRRRGTAPIGSRIGCRHGDLRPDLHDRVPRLALATRSVRAPAHRCTRRRGGVRGVLLHAHRRQRARGLRRDHLQGGVGAPALRPRRASWGRSRASSEITDRYLQLPPGLGSEVGRLAREVTSGLEHPYDRARALQDWFQQGFTYDLDVAAGHDIDSIEGFLATRRGYCEQFAGTFAAMARSIGLPARVAVGFTPGDQDATNPDLWHVTGRHAHAWPEVYLPEVGWVGFEPTPGRGAPSAEAYTGIPEQQEGEVQPPDDPRTTTTTDNTDPGGEDEETDPTTPTGAPGTDGSGPPVPDQGGGRWRGPARVAALGFALALSYGMGVVLLKGRKARRRRDAATNTSRTGLCRLDRDDREPVRGRPPSPTERDPRRVRPEGHRSPRGRSRSLSSDWHSWALRPSTRGTSPRSPRWRRPPGSQTRSGTRSRAWSGSGPDSCTSSIRGRSSGRAPPGWSALRFWLRGQVGPEIVIPGPVTIPG